MPFGLAVSITFHVALLVWAFISIQSTPEIILPEVPVIEASLITVSELTRLKQGNPDSKELEAKLKEEPKPDISKQEAPKPKPVTAPQPPAPPPPPPEPEAAKPAEPPPPPPKAAEPPPPPPKAAEPAPPPEPAPGPTPEDQKKLEEKLEQERVAEEQRKKQVEEQKKKEAEERKLAEEKRKLEEEQKRKAELKKKEDEKKRAEDEKKRKEKKKLAEQKRKDEEKKKKQFDADRIAALIDKSPDKRGAPQAAATPPSKPTDYTGPTAGERDGRDTELTAREQDLLLAKINKQLLPCSNLPGGGGGPETPVVVVRFRLKPDGALDGDPVLVGQQNSTAYTIAANASLKAVAQCAPFDLPQELYKSWKSVTWTFDWPVILGLVQR